MHKYFNQSETSSYWECFAQYGWKIKNPNKKIETKYFKKRI